MRIDWPKADEEHQQLFDLCGQLQAAVNANAPQPEVRSILRKLSRQATQHFAHEEREMRADGYAHYAWHRRQHLAAQARVKLLEPRIRSGEREAVRELLEFLPHWLNDHIGIADRMLAAHMRNRQRANLIHSR